MNVIEEASSEEVAMCMICDDEEVANSLNDYPCCNHSCHFGIQCLKRIVSDKIADSALSNLVCPYPECKKPFGEQLVKALATESDYNKYISDLDDLKEKLKHDNISVLARNLVKKAQYFFQDTVSNCAQLFRRVTVDSKRCPNCRYIIEKDGGCMHMTCRKCSYQFHWCCGQKYSNNHSDSLCQMIQWLFPSMAILTPIVALLLNSYTRAAIYSAFASFLYLSKFSNLNEIIWLPSYLACTVLVACFFGKLWRPLDNEHLSNSIVLYLVFLSSSLTYASNQPSNRLAKLIEDPNPYTGFQQLLLLACMSMDQYDLKELLYKWKSRNHLANIVLGFALAYLTGSPLFHAYYIIPFCYSYSYQLDDGNFYRFVNCGALIMAVCSIYVARMSYSSYISNSFGFIILSFRIFFLYLLKDDLNNANYDLKRFIMDIEAITGRKWATDKAEKIFIFLNYIAIGSYLVVGSTFSTVAHVPLSVIENLRFISFSLISMVTKLLNFSALFNFSIMIFRLLYWAIESSYWIFTFSVFLKTSLLWFSRIKVSGSLKNNNISVSKVFFSILYVTFLYVVMVRSNATLNERFVYNSINFCLALIFTNRDKSKTRPGKSEIVADFEYEYKNFMAVDWILYTAYMTEPFLSPCISDLVSCIIFCIPGYHTMMFLLLSTAIAAPLYYFSYIK